MGNTALITQSFPCLIKADGLDMNHVLLFYLASSQGCGSDPQRALNRTFLMNKAPWPQTETLPFRLVRSKAQLSYPRTWPSHRKQPHWRLRNPIPHNSPCTTVFILTCEDRVGSIPLSGSGTEGIENLECFKLLSKR